MRRLCCAIATGVDGQWYKPRAAHGPAARAINPRALIGPAQLLHDAGAGSQDVRHQLDPGDYDDAEEADSWDGGSGDEVNFDEWDF